MKNLYVASYGFTHGDKINIIIEADNSLQADQILGSNGYFDILNLSEIKFENGIYVIRRKNK